MRRCAGENDAAPIIDSKYLGGHSKYRNGVSVHSPECVGLRRHAEHQVRTLQTVLESGRSLSAQAPGPSLAPSTVTTRTPPTPWMRPGGEARLSCRPPTA
jgi:hypothetical protein